MTETVLDTINAQWFNTVVAGLNVAPSEFQLSQGELMLPQTTDDLWDMMNQLPVESVVGYYTANNLVNFSAEYTSLLSFVQSPGSAAFATAMGTDNMASWNAAKKAWFAANPNAYSEPPQTLQKSLEQLFQNWATVNLDPGPAGQCYTLYRAAVENPIYIAQELQDNLPVGGPTAFNLSLHSCKKLLAAGPSVSFAMNSTTASSDLSNAWSSSSSSAGGSYFYSKSSSSQATDFTQTFASSTFDVAVAYQHVATVPVVALSGEDITVGAVDYLPWYYGAALAYAYNNPGAPVWTDPTQWNALFGPNGSFQYVVTDLIAVDGVNTTITTGQTYSTAEQKYAESQSSEGYGCWPYYVTNNSDTKTTSSTSFNSSSQMTVTTVSGVGHPLVVGVLVSSVKSLVTAIAAAE